jgi:hypothetical protein
MLSQRVGAAARVRDVIEQMRQVVFQHAAARAGGDDDVVIASERLDDAAAKIARGAAVAAVLGRLAAASLRAWHRRLAAGLLQQGDGGEADRGAIQVHQAGNE